MPIKEYNATKFFYNTGREAPPGVLGCYLSHLKVFKMFLESDREFALICEDDAMPTTDAYAVLKQAIAHAKTWDLLRLFTWRSDKSFPYRSLPHPSDTAARHSLYTQIGCTLHTAAYMVNRRAAEILLQKLVPMPDQYDLALFQGRVGVREATIFPNCFLWSGHSSGNTTIDNTSWRDSRKWKPWHVVFWTRAFYRLRVRVVRYSLQYFRMFKRRFSGSQ
jgi:glycosyl transferase family 25